MKIEAKKLSNFLNKVTLGGIITDAILKFNDEGLKVTLKEPSNICAISGLLKKEEFQNYEVINIPIKNTKLLIDFLNSVSGIVDLRKDINDLRIETEKTEAELKMPSEEFVESNLDKFPELTYEGNFLINSAVLKDGKKNCDILKATKINLKVENKVLKITSGEEGFDKLLIKEKVEFKDVQSSFGDMFSSLMNFVDGNVNLYMKDNFPLTIEEKTENYMIKWLLAPIVSKEE